MEKDKTRFNKIVLFRVDANSTIGMGHMMRCISIATAMMQANAQETSDAVTFPARRFECDTITPVFIVSDDDSSELLRDRGLEYVCLYTDYRNKMTEVDRGIDSSIGSLLRRFHPVSMLVDSYQVSNEYFTALRRIAEDVAVLEGVDRTRFYYLDDVDVPNYELDGMINYNIYAVNLPYPQEKCFLGSKYIPLGERFWNIKSRFNNNVYQDDNIPQDNGDTPHNNSRADSEPLNNCLISSGGADMLNICYSIAEVMAPSYPDCAFHVVCGKYNVHRSELMDLAKLYPNIRVEYDVRDMCTLEQSCDVAISAAGSTMYELAALGIPTITYFFADNQCMIAETFAEQTGLCNAGDFRLDRQAVLANIRNRFEEYRNDTLTRRNAGRSIRHLTDGMGAFRIAGILTGKE